jgi:hypothetical protein
MNINFTKFKKIIGCVVMALLVCSVGFADVQQNTDKTYVAKISIQPNSADTYVAQTETQLKVKLKIIGYGVIKLLENDKFGASIIFEGDNTPVQFKTQKEVDFAAANGLENKVLYENKIIEMQRDPLHGNNIELLKNLGKDTITAEGYIIIAYKNQEITNRINLEREKIIEDMSENDKKDIEDEIKKLENEIEDNKNIIYDNLPTVEEQAKILTGFTPDEKSELLSTIAEKECEGSWNPFCEFFTEQSSEQAIKKSFLQNIDNSIENKDEYNTKLYKQFSDLYNGISCDSKISCNANIENIKNVDGYISSCDNYDKQCEKSKIREMENLLSSVNKIERVETNWIYSVFDAINNQDQSARASAKFFGFGADYSDLPNWLAEQGVAASQICIGEIDGYLDEDSSTGGSTIKSSGDLTKYGYDTNTSILDVAYDIRAKRTKTTPDGKTYMTLSVYLKAPTSDNITYMLGLSYKSGDRFYKKSLLNKTTILAGEEISELYSYDIKVKHPAEVHKGSFFLYLKARTGSGTVIANDNTNVYLVISGEDNNIVLGNNEGNSQDSTNEDVEPATDDFWDGFDD